MKNLFGLLMIFAIMGGCTIGCIENAMNQAHAIQEDAAESPP